jgi:hypothetical protein
VCCFFLIGELVLLLGSLRRCRDVCGDPFKQFLPFRAECGAFWTRGQSHIFMLSLWLLASQPSKQSLAAHEYTRELPKHPPILLSWHPDQQSSISHRVSSIRWDQYPAVGRPQKRQGGREEHSNPIPVNRKCIPPIDLQDNLGKEDAMRKVPNICRTCRF